MWHSCVSSPIRWRGYQTRSKHNRHKAAYEVCGWHKAVEGKRTNVVSWHVPSMHNIFHNIFIFGSLHITEVVSDFHWLFLAITVYPFHYKIPTTFSLLDLEVSSYYRLSLSSRSTFSFSLHEILYFKPVIWFLLCLFEVLKFLYVASLQRFQNRLLDNIDINMYRITEATYTSVILSVLLS